jgi:hypothetical protein
MCARVFDFPLTRPNDAMGHERRLTLPAATSAITLNADIRLRCTK